MPTYSLDLSDITDTSFLLYGVKTSLEDYRLAYFLNKYLETKFERAEKNLTFDLNNIKHHYSLFNFEDTVNYNNWFLIANKFKQSSVNYQVDNLFTSTNYHFDSINYLIPERKSFDYFIKITGGIEAPKSLKLLRQIKSINLIEAVFEVKPEDLKSKDFLIF